MNSESLHTFLEFEFKTELRFVARQTLPIVIDRWSSVHVRCNMGIDRGKIDDEAEDTVACGMSTTVLSFPGSRGWPTGSIQTSTSHGI
jgi:hypothetical protein